MLLGQFWGTGDGKSIPAPYCRCAVCNEAREKGIPFARTRSCFRLSDKVMIDLGADAVYQARMFGDLADLEHVIITHTHEDHLNTHMLMEAFWLREKISKVHYWFTEKAYDIVDEWRNSPWVLKGMLSQYEKDGVIEFHKLSYGVPQSIAGMKVIPFKGNHFGNVGENSALYLIELPDGRRLFYGLDSGPYLPETLEALKGHKIDIFISEATAGTRVPQVHFDINRQHMVLTDVKELACILFNQGTLATDSRMYLTHIADITSHSQMENAVKELNFPIPTEVAYDGKIIL